MTDREPIAHPSDAKPATDGDGASLAAPSLQNDSARPSKSPSSKSICGMDGEGTPIAAGRSGMLGRFNADGENATTPEERVGEARIRSSEAGRNRAGTSPGDATRRRALTPHEKRTRIETVGK